MRHDRPVPEVIAHRGDSRAPENTMVSFAFALAAGVDGIETDVRLSADGVACLIHDPDLDRTTDQQGPVVARTMAELARCDAAATGPEHGFSGVPSLAQLAAACRQRARLCLDLKVDGAVEAVRAALAEADFPQEQVILCAWNPGQRADVRRWLPGARAFYIEPREGSPSRRDLPWFAELASAHDGLSLAFEGLDPEFIQRAQEHDLELITWTVNETEDLDAMIRCGVDGIITDHPALLRQLLAGKPTAHPTGPA